MVGVLAQKWMKDEKAKRAKKEKIPTANQAHKDFEKKQKEALAEVVAEIDKDTIERCLKIAKEIK